VSFIPNRNKKKIEKQQQRNRPLSCPVTYMDRGVMGIKITLYERWGV
jgi:hypothetical protein